ncbi:hypothetical protein Tco_1002152 [Tanacetum coccineum]|uniref:Transposase (putative) gypsy type domain-containing protein n=1 Tax=Tanacetum coccineum TaxID=301880 RepID=A0ABQ5F625_9ASTR
MITRGQHSDLVLPSSTATQGQRVSRWHVSDFVLGVKVVFMLQVLVVDQTSVTFVHRTSVVGVLAPMETMLYLLRRYCTLPPEGTCCSLPPEGTSCSLPLEETGCSLPPEETSCSLPLEGTSCSLPLEETSYSLPLEGTSYSLVIASGTEVAFVTPAISVDRSNMEWFCLRNIRKVGLSDLDRRARSELSVELIQSGIDLSLSGGVWVRSEWNFLRSSGSLGLRDSAHFFYQLLKVYIDFHLTFLMAKKDMHTYVSRLKDTELETLIATYDIPLDLRPRLPDPNFRMIILPAGDTAIGIYSRIFDSSGVRIPFSSFLLAMLKYFKVHISQLVPLGLSKVITFEVLCRSLNIEPTVTLFRVFQTLSKQGDWFSFAKRGDPAPVCMEVAKSGLKLWKEKFFLIDRRAIPFHMPWRHPDSCITDKVPTSFNQDHIDQLKAHIVKLRDIPEGVLVRSGLSRVWRNPMCDPVLRRSDNTVMSIYDFLCMPSLDKVTVREEHRLETSILGRVADSTTSPTPAAKKTRSNQKWSGVGSSRQAAGDEVEQTDDDVIYPPILLLDKEVEAHVELSGGVRRATKASFHASYGVSEDASPHAQEAVPAPDAQALDADTGADEIASDGNVDPYYKARVGNTAGDVLERDLLPIVPGPYYIHYPYDEGSGSESPLYTKDDWEEIHGVNLGLQKKELYKDPKVCRTALDRFPTPAETHRILNARYDHSLRNVERLSKQCAQQTQTIKRQNADLKQQNESIVRAIKEVSRLTAQLGVFKSRCQTAEHKLSSWDKKHRKYRNERDTLAMEKEKIEEELVGTESQLEHRERQAEEIQGSIASFFQLDFTPLVRRFLKSGEFNREFTGVLNMEISVGVERGLRMDRTDEEFKELSQRVVGFIPDANSLKDIARLEPDSVTPSHQTSSAMASLRANTHV